MYYGFNLRVWRDTHIALKNNLGNQYKMLLLCGGTGSGKSYALLNLLGVRVKEGNVDITFSDFKNSEDFAFLSEYKKYYSGDDVYEGIKKYYEEFTLARQNRTPIIPHLLIIDEYPSLLIRLQEQDRLNKTKKANEVTSMIGELLMLGRGLNYGVWISCQRADSSWFVNGARDNFQIVIALGRISKEQRQMLFSGFDFEAESIYVPGEGICLADGKEMVEVKFPLIENIDDWKKHIVQKLVTSD